MATTNEKIPESDIAKNLVTVPDDKIASLTEALIAEDDYAIKEYFYTRSVEVTKYLNGLPLKDRVDASFNLMHDQLDALSAVDADDEKRASLRLNADALMQTCLVPLPPYAPWRLVGLMSHATMKATDVASDILLPLLTQKIAELPPNAFDTGHSDAPLGVHLLRIRSLGTLSMYHDNSWKALGPILERYTHMDVPLIAMAADIEIDNCGLDNELHNNGEDPEQLTAHSADVLQRQAVYEGRYHDVVMPDSFDQYKQYVRIAADAVAVYALGNNVERFVRIQPGVPLERQEFEQDEIIQSVDAYEETAYPLLYDCHVLGAIGDRLGLDVLRLPLVTQQHLFDFMVESDTERFGRVERIIGNMPGNERVKFAEAFLATEFGDQLGESILEIAEKSAGNKEALEIFEHISTIRENLTEWESVAWFAQADNEYRDYFEGLKSAIEMRISQILSPVPDLMDGIPQKAEYFHRDGTLADTVSIDSVEMVIQGLKIIALQTKKCADAEKIPIEKRRSMANDDYTASVADGDGAEVRMTMRPLATADAEARMRWATIITPEEQMAIFGEYLDINSQGLPRNARASLKLDLEKISGKLALDFGSRMEYGSSKREYPNRLIANLVTAGVQHDLRKQGKDIAHADYHVRSTFEKPASDEGRFARFVLDSQKHYVDPNKAMLGAVSSKALDLGVSPERGHSNVVYTGLFFDQNAVQKVFDEIFPHKLPNIPKTPHITVKYHPKDGLKGFTLGESHAVKVVGYVDNGSAQALIVESDTVSGVANPHITVATGNNARGKKIPPEYSKQAIKEAYEGGRVVMLERPIELQGVSGYFDGETGQVVTQAKSLAA